MPGRAESLALRSYTIAEGLAHDHVSRIYRDSNDFLWICTDEGLSRFDGRRFVNYTTADGVPHIHVNDVIEARNGDYWIGTDGGLALFSPGHPGQRFVTFKPDGPPEALFANAVLEEPDGAVLVGTGNGLYRLRRTGSDGRFEHVRYGAPPGVPAAISIHTLHRDREGSLWVGTSGGLFQERAGTCVRYMPRDGLPHDFVDRIVADREGRIMICARHGLARLAANLVPGAAVDLTVTQADGLPHRDVRTILFAADGSR
jgi:ligand-binding sensor domain-containing protein